MYLLKIEKIRGLFHEFTPETLLPMNIPTTDPIIIKYNTFL
jgi:hypothetical protein